MSTFTPFDSGDVVEGNISRNITTGLFTGGGEMVSFHSSSAQTSSAAGTNYYYDVYHQDPDDANTNDSAEVQFQVAYGHYAGSGSHGDGNTLGFHPSRAIYSQFRNLLLDSPSPTTLFKLANGNNVERAVFITMERARFKEKIDKGDWSMQFTSSMINTTFTVADSSGFEPETIENGHIVYNVVSGSDEGGANRLHKNSSDEYEYWGKVYPELGIIMLDGERMLGSTHATRPNDTHLNLNKGNTPDDAEVVHRDVINSMVKFAGRADEDISSTFYFVRAKNSDYNFSTNETFVDGGAGRLRHSTMIGDPQVFISGIGLYNSQKELLAIAKLSKPLHKSYEREATIRVKLDY